MEFFSFLLWEKREWPIGSYAFLGVIEKLFIAEDAEVVAICCLAFFWANVTVEHKRKAEKRDETMARNGRNDALLQRHVEAVGQQEA
jgi:hypothetical protein